MKEYIFYFVLFFSSKFTFSQPQTNNWFFCTNNGLSFSSGSPVTVPGGQIVVMEGASSISDSNGQLLFYTDGITVWDRMHNAMPNGGNLHGGHSSSTQSSLIVPKTADGKEYYIFTTDEEGDPWGLQYSVVDMTLNSGRGDVLIAWKNVPLIAPTSEKVTAVRHCNKKDFWVITHEYNSDAFYAYLATATGVNPVPVISHTGSFIPDAYSTMGGGLKSSPDGRKLVAAHGSIGLELMDFNNQTGVVSNAVEIFQNSNSLPYGVEFSSNSSKLYAAITHYWDNVDITRYSGVFQFDLSLPTISDIINSKTQLSRYPQGNELGQMQRGPDGKIYMAQFQKMYLSIINSPNVAGTGCNFVTNGVALPNQGKFSVPNLLNDYGTLSDSFLVNNGCANVPVQFSYNLAANVSSVLWNFDDPSSGSQNTSTLLNPIHIYTTSGSYTVKLIKYGVCGNDTLIKRIAIGDVAVDLGPDKSFCANSTVLLTPASSGSSSYLWQDGNTAQTYTASNPGLYWVQVSSLVNGCVKRDSIILTAKPVPLVYLGKDTSLCVNESLILDAQNVGSTYLWQNNSNQQTQMINQGGEYWVEVDLNGCKKRDTIIITDVDPPQFSLGADQFLCPGLTLQLQPNATADSYLWQDGSINSTFTVMQPGLYYVDLINNCGVTRDSVNVVTGNCTIYIPSAFTPNNDGLNDHFSVYGTGLVDQFNLKVFDRGGQIVFQSKDKNARWDGKLRGAKLPTGVYVYLLSYNERSNPESRILKGVITLIR